MNFKKAGIFRRSSEGSEQPEVQNDSGGMLAVSYTHLDVYKRQIHRSKKNGNRSEWTEQKKITARGRIPGWGKRPLLFCSFCSLIRDSGLGKEQQCEKKNY